ncbi:hypothetical protein [Lacipirellula parvula]|uniref:Uncharacterized protein n=1 Tax=Lacipirellula parvula TaxID=2650471 RepID=A0A5K7X7N7_9BACT|nr:hypothetical protein [Lacipirellula parvula]BBO30741.1 hypothetical protein PLANPX_0353 [Lacipirellula parvula]
MRSIAGAMAWELVTRGRWQVVGAALATFALPLLVLASMGTGATSFGRDGDLSNQLLGFCFVQTNILALVASLLALSATMHKRLYSYPATAATLMHGLILPAAAIIAVDLIVWTAVMNAAFRLQWPTLEPAIFGAAIIVVAYSAMWLTYQSRWMLFALTVVSGVFSFWIKSHFGPMFGELKHPWQSMTAAEAICLLTITAISYRLGVQAFARSRRGERPFSTGVISWLDDFSERRIQGRKTTTFAAPLAAQTWYFEQRSWVAPASVLSASAFAFVLWMFVNRDPGDLVEAYAFSGGMVSIATAIGGLFLGALGSKDQTSIGQFLASRPITTVDMSRQLLVVTARSFLKTWACWGVIFLLILFLAWLAGASPMQRIPPAHRWALLFGAILLSWATMATAIVMALADRGRLIFRVITYISFGFIALLLLNDLVVHRFGRDEIVHAFGALFGVTATAATVASFYYAFHRGLLQPRIAMAAVVVWVILLAAGANMLPAMGPQDRMVAKMAFLDVTARTLVLGSLSLVVAPIAATPLALAWNRTR